MRNPAVKRILQARSLPKAKHVQAARQLGLLRRVRLAQHALLSAVHAFRFRTLIAPLYVLPGDEGDTAGQQQRAHSGSTRGSWQPLLRAAPPSLHFDGMQTCQVCVQDNIFEWHFVIRGPPDTEFEVRSSAQMPSSCWPHAQWPRIATSGYIGIHYVTSHPPDGHATGVTQRFCKLCPRVHRKRLDVCDCCPLLAGRCLPRAHPAPARVPIQAAVIHHAHPEWPLRDGRQGVLRLAWRGSAQCWVAGAWQVGSWQAVTVAKQVKQTVINPADNLTRTRSKTTHILAG